MGTNERFWAKVEKGEGCWLWTAAKNSDGYGVFRAKGENVRAHRFAFELLVGPIPDGLCVLHHCDTPPCVNPDHLFLGTNADNMADKTTKGRGNSPQGEAQGSAKLTEEQVREIRAAYAQGGVRQRQIGWWFGVTQMTISYALRGRNWVHVK